MHGIPAHKPMYASRNREKFSRAFYLFMSGLVEATGNGSSPYAKLFYHPVMPAYKCGGGWAAWKKVYKENPTIWMVSNLVRAQKARHPTILTRNVRTALICRCLRTCS